MQRQPNANASCGAKTQRRSPNSARTAAAQTPGPEVEGRGRLRVCSGRNGGLSPNDLGQQARKRSEKGLDKAAGVPARLRAQRATFLPAGRATRVGPAARFGAACFLQPFGQLDVGSPVGIDPGVVCAPTAERGSGMFPCASSRNRTHAAGKAAAGTKQTSYAFCREWSRAALLFCRKLRSALSQTRLTRPRRAVSIECVEAPCPPGPATGKLRPTISRVGGILR